MYNEKVMNIFQNPEHMGDLKGANAIGQVGNMACGDIMKIFLKINENDIIEDASFKTFGCVAAIVSSSVACGLVIGKTIEEALNFNNDDVIKEVGDLPVHKVHCSVLAKEAIEDAINNYRKAQERSKKKDANKKEKQNNKKQVKKVDKGFNKLNNLMSKLDKK